MAKLFDEKKDNDNEGIKAEISLVWKKEDITYIYNEYFREKFIPTSWSIAEKLGYVKGNAVINPVKMNTTSWTVWVIRKGIDSFDKIEAAGNELTDFDRMKILDNIYTEKLNMIAVEWGAIGKHNNK